MKRCVQWNPLYIKKIATGNRTRVRRHKEKFISFIFSEFSVVSGQKKYMQRNKFHSQYACLIGAYTITRKEKKSRQSD